MIRKIEVVSRDELNRIRTYLKQIIPEKSMRHRYISMPPKYYKSSKYRVWFGYGLSDPNEFGTVMSTYKIYFRDEEDYLLTLLMK